ncbi:MAG TPA: type II toxin-antitoxin system VapC family toxin [Stellaceae bacterium]|nr:type II toxin-antitoxin system VapC family toxin [Stellaceae bacterium]
MDLLLDTHAFLWWDSASTELGAAAAAAIADPGNRVFVSAACVWEIAIKRRLGRLAFAGSAAAAIEANGFTSLPIGASDGERVETLPPIHQDPFDRIMIAQCLEHGLVLVTADDRIGQYGLPLIRAR